MKTEITRLEIENEMDIVLAHRRAMQIARFAGINISEQTRFATAIAEICRNALEFAGSGTIVYSIVLGRNNAYILEALVSDKGPGIKELENILSRNLQTHTSKGRGIIFSKKLVDQFRIQTNTRGTNVTLGVHVPVNAAPVNNLIIQGWISHIKNEPALTAYEELKIRNAGLMQLTDELKLEQQKTEKQLNEIRELNEKLQKTNDYLEEFTYTVSHDLKTPLTTLNLSLHFLEQTEDPESKMTYIDLIGKAAKRFEKTIKGLIEILDVQTKNQKLVKKISLDELFEDARDGILATTAAKDITISPDFMVSDVHYLAPYLNSIFSNLLGNAVKYRSPERPLEITVSSRRKGNAVALVFADNGEGIDLEKNGARLFTPFARFNSRQEGKGIGLYIIKKMIEKNGGRIEVESEKGKGTRFTIYLKEYPAVA